MSVPPANWNVTVARLPTTRPDSAAHTTRPQSPRARPEKIVLSCHSSCSAISSNSGALHNSQNSCAGHAAPPSNPNKASGASMNAAVSWAGAGNTSERDRRLSKPPNEAEQCARAQYGRRQQGEQQRLHCHRSHVGWNLGQPVRSVVIEIDQQPAQRAAGDGHGEKIIAL